MAGTTRREAFRRAGEEWRRGNVGRSIFDAFQIFERDLLETLEREGYGQIRRVHLALYRNLDFDGTRLTELARRASMTKQGMQELVDRAVAMGFVERREDPDDRRAKIVAFSDMGLLLLDALHKGIREAERRMGESIGEDTVRLLASALDRYAGKIVMPAATSAVE